MGRRDAFLFQLGSLVVGSSVLSIPASIVPIPDSLLNFQRSFVHSRCVERACATMCWDGRCVLSMVAVPECVLTMRLIPWGFQPCLLISPQIAPEVCDWAAQESDRHIICNPCSLCLLRGKPQSKSTDRSHELRNYYQGEKELFCFVVRMNPCVIHGKDQRKSVGTKGGINSSQGIERFNSLRPWSHATTFFELRSKFLVTQSILV
jgi:hypothetical protein